MEIRIEMKTIPPKALQIVSKNKSRLDVLFEFLRRATTTSVLIAHFQRTLRTNYIKSVAGILAMQVGLALL